MKEKLFQEAFKKAEMQSGKTSKNGISTHLENVFAIELKFQTSKITFSRYYEQFVEERTDKEMNPSTELLDHLAKYLGFVNYEDFVTGIVPPITPTEPPENPPKSNGVLRFLKKYNWLIILILLTIITIVVVMQFNKQRWMVWDGTQYKEVAFDLKKYDIGQLKLYKEDRIKNFKKVEVNCETTFFNSDGSPKIWYGKNQQKELEYFTSIGLHPETGNSLKKITPYMIRVHVCPEDTENSNKN